MPYLIGTDEAGYGPNLGPLTISASCWWVPEDPANTAADFDETEIDLFVLLRDFVCQEKSVDQPPRVAIADSKSLYQTGSGLGLLEQGVHAALRELGHRPADWGELWRVLVGSTGAPDQPLPWYEDYTCRLPLDATRQQIDGAADSLRRGLEQSGTRLIALRSVALFPQQFNELVDQLGSKGAVLTRLTLELLGDVLEAVDGPALVVCDKHGGRNKYAMQLQHHFPEYLVEIHGESRPQSVYRWGPAEQRVEIRFQTKGERFLPAAPASMASKYLRELAMRAFNEFWRSRKPDLRATAGYPVDAKRFKKDIAQLQQELAIDDRCLWRSR